jgi:polysaccharide deacetylase family protein (PEP-CTERM system associated)
MIKNFYRSALTVDVEDGINIGMRDLMGKTINPTERVVSNTKRILDLFARHETKGTFFVLGQVAEHYPELIKEIDAAGHEIGVHGYDHYQFFRMDYDFAYDQLERARKLLQDLTGQPVEGHRAPAFSINSETSWGLYLIAELGFRYDSSIMPCKGLNYGWDEFGKDLTHVKMQSGKELYEFPMSTTTLFGREIPCLGGSYLRLLPRWVNKKMLNNVAKDRNPIIFIHPYELDEERYPDFFFEELKGTSLKSKIRVKFMSLNREKVIGKLELLLSNYKHTTMANILNQTIAGDQQIPVLYLNESGKLKQASDV